VVVPAVTAGIGVTGIFGRSVGRSVKEEGEEEEKEE
jgi:hypothetical protein